MFSRVLVLCLVLTFMKINFKRKELLQYTFTCSKSTIKTVTVCEIGSELTLKTPERHSVVFVAIYEHK